MDTQIEVHRANPNQSSWRYAIVGLLAAAIYLALPHSIQNVTYALFPVAAAVLAFWRATTRTPERKAWISLGIGFALFALADALYPLYPAFPGPSDALNLAGYVAVILGALGMRDRGRKDRPAYLTRSFDAGIVAVSACSVVWLTWVAPAGDLVRTSGSEKALALSYPLLDLVVLAVIISGGRLVGARLWLAAGLVSLIGADLWYSIAALRDTYETGVLVDFAWLATSVAAGAAALSPPGRAESPDVVPKGWTRVLLTVCLATSLGTFSYHAIILDQIYVGTAIITAVAVTVLIALRLEVTHRHIIEILRLMAEKNLTLQEFFIHTESLRKQHQLILDSAGEGIIGIDQRGAATFINQAAIAMLGYTASDLGDDVVHDLVHHSKEDGTSRIYEECLVHTAIRTGTLQQATNEVFWRKDGTKVYVEYTANPICEGKVVTGAVVTFRDVSAFHDLEEQVRQSQRLEAMGRLAGGIAHDFNNLLAVIGNYAEFIEEGLPTAAAAHEDVQAIQEAADKGAALVRQLLAFSRRDLVRPQNVHVNAVLRGMEKLLQPALGEDVLLQLECGRGLWDVYMDPGHLEQVLMNLAVNARDAMPEGGTFSFTTRNVAGQAADTVAIEVSDTGCGMNPEVLAHAFEPFFTTKRDKGSGLGLATVYGIVTQAGGSIEIESHENEGTTFFISLPRSEEPAMGMDVDAENRGGTSGTEKILIVEDEDAVRSSVARSLSQAGYAVSVAASASEALSFIDDGFLPDLIVSDVVMPEISGPMLIERLALIGHVIPVLFMSGYSEEVLQRRGLFGQGAALLQKPFKKIELLHAVRSELDRHPPSSSNWSRRAQGVAGKR